MVTATLVAACAGRSIEYDGDDQCGALNECSPDYFFCVYQDEAYVCTE